MLNYVLFTHDDMDGYGSKLIMDIYMSALCANDKYEVAVCGNATVDGIVMQWLQDTEKLGPDTMIIFSDIAPSPAIADILAIKVTEKEVAGVVVLDHHETNMWIKDVFPNSVMMIDDAFGVLQSGTSLMHVDLPRILGVNPAENILDGFNQRLLADLVDTIRSYDTYEWKMSKNINAKKLQILFGMVGGDNFVKKYFNRITSNDPDNSLIIANDLEFVDCKYNYEQSVIDKMSIDDIVPISIRGYKAALMIKSIPANISEVAYQFLEKHPEFDVFIQFSLFNGGSFAFRTQREDLHVGRVFAAPIGGGGHPKASGSQLPDFLKNAIQDAVIRWLNGNNMQVSISTMYTNEESE